MIYTLRKGVDDRHEKVESYILRGLPILVASAIAIFGAFSNANQDNGRDSNNQEPLAIYTAPPTDLGRPTNPQGDGTDTQNNGNRPPSDGAGEATMNTQNEARAPAAAPTGTGGQETQPVTGIIGGRGGDTGGGGEADKDGCLCENLQEAADPSNVTGPVGDILNETTSTDVVPKTP